VSLLAIRRRLGEVCQFADRVGDWQLQGDIYAELVAEDLEHVAELAREHGTPGAAALASHIESVAASVEARTATVEDILRLCVWPPELWEEYDDDPLAP